jgi:hypothetical protein
VYTFFESKYIINSQDVPASGCRSEEEVLVAAFLEITIGGREICSNQTEKAKIAGKTSGVVAEKGYPF